MFDHGVTDIDDDSSIVEERCDLAVVLHFEDEMNLFPGGSGRDRYLRLRLLGSGQM